jgi:hypothetical protein
MSQKFGPISKFVFRKAMKAIGASIMTIKQLEKKIINFSDS